MQRLEANAAKKLAAIEKDLGTARDALAAEKGREAEVYSRIVGYYRSVRNWNKGKREEFGDRQVFSAESGAPAFCTEDEAAMDGGFCESCQVPAADTAADSAGAAETGGLREVETTTATETAGRKTADANPRLLLFVQSGCPACPGAKTEASKLAGAYAVDMETVEADTEAGLAEAQRLGVISTPTAILLNGGVELFRAQDSAEMAGMREVLEKIA